MSSINLIPGAINELIATVTDTHRLTQVACTAKSRGQNCKKGIFETALRFLAASGDRDGTMGLTSD